MTAAELLSVLLRVFLIGCAGIVGLGLLAFSVCIICVCIRDFREDHKKD